jgi:hypothetical protein
MFKFLILLLVLQTASAQSWSKFQLVNGCTIFSYEGKRLKNFPGQMCIFFDDGSFLSATQKGLSLIDKNSKVLWNLSGHFHHQINMSQDGKRVLALSSEIVMRKNKSCRVDKMMVITIEGNVLHTVLADDLLKQAKLSEDIRPSVPDLAKDVGAPFELSHFNSFYEIPKMTGDSAPKFLQTEGAYVVNGLSDAIFILSPDLKNLIQTLNIPQSTDHQVHDVQISSNAHLLYFNNMTSDSSDLNRISAIEEKDLKTDKIVFEFRAEPGAMFYSVFSGGVQALDDNHVLFSHVTTGTYIYSKAEKKLISTIVHTHFDLGRSVPSQQVKALDLSKFLAHWK